MPIKKLEFAPGISRDVTSLTSKGRWYDCDKIRFRAGAPQKLGGWERQNAAVATGATPPGGASYWGIARWLFEWQTLSGTNYLAAGTDRKLYAQQGVGGVLYDITPVRSTAAAGTVTVAATTGSSTVTVTHVGHGASAGDFVTIAGATSLGGNITAAVLSREFEVASATANTFTVVVSVIATAADTGNGGSATTLEFQLGSGSDINYSVAGWGAGSWGFGGWGTGIAQGSGRLRQWSGENYGQNLICAPRGGAMYLWEPPADNAFSAVRAGLLSSAGTGVYATDAACPTVVNEVRVSDASRFVLAFGCNDYGSATLDPLLVRWSDQENYALWQPSATNQAGSYRLSRGSRIVSARQARQEILVWTDAALYSMQYLGPPYIWGFTLLADNLSIISPKAVATATGVTYWMGLDKFYAYNGRAQALPCPVLDKVFGDMNHAQREQIVCGTNEGFDEVWWFYCSENSSSVDRYVIFNYGDNAWYYGSLGRTAWLDSNYREGPIAAGYSGMFIQHERGTDDASVSPAVPIQAYVQSADVDIGDGDRYALINKIVPDVTFDGSTSVAPSLGITLRPRSNPGGAPLPESSNPPVVSGNDYSLQRIYLVQRFTELVYSRVRGRQVAVRISSDTLGTQWRLGTLRIDVREDGRR